MADQFHRPDFSWRDFTAPRLAFEPLSGPDSDYMTVVTSQRLLPHPLIVSRLNPYIIDVLKDWSGIPVDEIANHLVQVGQLYPVENPIINGYSYLLPGIANLSPFKRFVQEIHGPDDLVLDIGTGMGQNLRHLANAGVPTSNMCAVDCNDAPWNIGHRLFDDGAKFFAIFNLLNFMDGWEQDLLDFMERWEQDQKQSGATFDDFALATLLASLGSSTANYDTIEGNVFDRGSIRSDAFFGRFGLDHRISQTRLPQPLISVFGRCKLIMANKFFEQFTLKEQVFICARVASLSKLGTIFFGMTLGLRQTGFLYTNTDHPRFMHSKHSFAAMWTFVEVLITQRWELSVSESTLDQRHWTLDEIAGCSVDSVDSIELDFMLKRVA